MISIAQVMRQGCRACAELLDVYRAAILRMQQQLRRMPSVSMASLNFSLQEFKAGALLASGNPSMAFPSYRIYHTAYELTTHSTVAPEHASLHGIACWCHTDTGMLHHPKSSARMMGERLQCVCDG